MNLGMGRFNRWMAMVTAGISLAAVTSTLAAAPALAQVAYGSYIGIGASVGLSDDDNGDGDGVSGVIAGRYRFLEAPISARAQALVFGDSFAFVPTVSYDVPLSWNTDAYLGAGVAFTGGDEPSAVGDTTSFVLQPGVDYIMPNNNLVLFGNAIIAFDAFEAGGGTAFSLQGGVGVQF